MLEQPPIFTTATTANQKHTIFSSAITTTDYC